MSQSRHKGRFRVTYELLESLLRLPRFSIIGVDGSGLRALHTCDVIIEHWRLPEIPVGGEVPVIGDAQVVEDFYDMAPDAISFETSAYRRWSRSREPPARQERDTGGAIDVTFEVVEDVAALALVPKP